MPSVPHSVLVRVCPASPDAIFVAVGLPVPQVDARQSADMAIAVLCPAEQVDPRTLPAVSPTNAASPNPAHHATLLRCQIADARENTRLQSSSPQTPPR